MIPKNWPSCFDSAENRGSISLDQGNLHKVVQIAPIAIIRMIPSLAWQESLIFSVSCRYGMNNNDKLQCVNWIICVLQQFFWNWVIWLLIVLKYDVSSMNCIILHSSMSSSMNTTYDSAGASVQSNRYSVCDLVNALDVWLHRRCRKLLHNMGFGIVECWELPFTRWLLLLIFLCILYNALWRISIRTKPQPSRFCWPCRFEEFIRVDLTRNISFFHWAFPIFPGLRRFKDDYLNTSWLQLLIYGQLVPGKRHFESKDSADPHSDLQSRTTVPLAQGHYALVRWWCIWAHWAHINHHLTRQWH